MAPGHLPTDHYHSIHDCQLLKPQEFHIAIKFGRGKEYTEKEKKKEKKKKEDVCVCAFYARTHETDRACTKPIELVWHAVLPLPNNFSQNLNQSLWSRASVSK